MTVNEERQSRRGVRPVTTLRVPPNDVDAEVELLGAMLLDERAASEGLAHAAATDCYHPSHQHVFAAIGAVVGRGEVADVRSVAAELRRAGLLDGLASGDSEGVAVLTTLLARAGLRSRVPHLAATVVAASRARAVVAAGEALATAGYASDLEHAALVAADAVEKLGARSVGASTWAPVDVGAVIDGGLDPSEATMLLRSDGVGLLYAGKVHALNAPPEAAKSLLALYVCRERIAAGEHVLYVDFEDDAQGILERLLALGVEPDQAAARFHYVRPDEPFGGVARAQLLNLVRLHRPTVAVLDGVAEAMAQNGWSENDNADVAAFLTALPRVLEREGCAVVLIDHLVKDKETQGRYARGAGHKLAGLSGAAYKLDVVRPLARGSTGVVRLVVTKDRPGWVRRSAAGGKAAEVEFISSDDGSAISVRVSPPENTGAFRPTFLMETISRVLEVAPDPMSVNQVLDSTTGNRNARLLALRCLVNEGYVEQTRRGQAHLHASVRPFREVEPEPEPVVEQPDFGEL